MRERSIQRDPHDPDGSINRREFEAAIKSLSAAIHELKADVQKRAPGLGNVITLGVMAATVLITSVQNFSKVNAAEAWISEHKEYEAQKAVSYADLVQRVRSSEKSIEEQEMQHRWMADVANLQDQRIEQLIRIQHPEIPPSVYWPLEQIGKADPK